MWKILVTLLILGVGAAALWVNAGQAEGPAIEIGGPGVIGQTGEIAVTVTAPRGELTGYRRVRRYERGRADPHRR